MKAKDVSVGGVYMAKVSGRIVPVRVLSWLVKYNDRTKRESTWYKCKSEVTGRDVLVKSVQRFRYPMAEKVNG